MEAKYDPETTVVPPNMCDGQDSVIAASVQDSITLLGRSTSSTEQPLSLSQDCSKISTSSSQYGFRSLDLRDESGADVCRKQNEVLIRSEMQRLFSDDSLSSSKRDDSFSSLYDYSLTSLSTDTQDSVSSMYRAATPIDTLKLPEEPIFPEDPGPLLYQNSAQYYRNLSHETDTDQSLTMSIPQKDNYSHPGTLKTINALIPFTSLSEVNAKLSESVNQGPSLPDLSSTSVKEQAAYRNPSPSMYSVFPLAIYSK